MSLSCCSGSVQIGTEPKKPFLSAAVTGIDRYRNVPSLKLYVNDLFNSVEKPKYDKSKYEIETADHETVEKLECNKSKYEMVSRNRNVINQNMEWRRALNPTL